MRILVTNDDGIASGGLKTLASVLVKKGHNVIVVAPDGNRSAFSHSLSIHKNQEQSVCQVFYSLNFGQTKQTIFAFSHTSIGKINSHF